MGEGEASGVISPNFGQSTSCLGLSLPALPTMNGGTPAFSKIFIQNAEIQPLHVYMNRISALEAIYNHWQPIFNELGGGLNTKSAAGGGGGGGGTHYRKATIMGDLQKTLQNRAAAFKE